MTGFHVIARGGVFVWGIPLEDVVSPGAGTSAPESQFIVYSRNRVFDWGGPKAVVSGSGLSVSATPASASASGVTASVDLGLAVDAAIASAVASGASAVVSLALQVNAAPAGAGASGVSADVDFGGIDAGPAIATAAGAAAAVSLGLTISAAPAVAAAASPGALIVTLLEGDTESVYYFPVRYFASASSGAVTATSDLDNLRSLLPSQRQQVINPDGTMAAPWYRFFDYFVNVFAGGPSAPTMADVQAAIEQALSELQTQQQTVALVASQSQTNAEALAATVEVVRTSSLPGSTSIPSVSLSYLEP